MLHDYIVYVIKRNHYQMERLPANRCYSTEDFLEDYNTSAPIGNGLYDTQIFSNLEDAERAFYALTRTPAKATINGSTKEVEYEVASLLKYSYTLDSLLSGKTAEELVASNTENDQIILGEQFSLDELIPAHLVQYSTYERNGAKMVAYTYTFPHDNRKLLQTALVDEFWSDHEKYIELYQKISKKSIDKV